MANEFAVGDILIGKAGVDYITQGREYEVTHISRRGIANVLDNDGDDCEAYPCDFTLKAIVPPARISIESIQEGEQAGLRLITVEVDGAGAEALSDLIKATSKERVAQELRAEIASLTAQLQAL